MFDDDSENREEPKKSGRSLLSIFRKRIPDEEELAKKEAEKKKQAQLDAMQDDVDEVIDQNHSEVAEPVDDSYEEDAVEAQTSPQKKKEGSFMGKLFNFKSRKQQEHDDHEMALQEQQQSIEDLKETIKLLHKWLEKLPPDKIAEFKKSPDFEKYKDGLRKLGLIKE